MTAEHHPFSSLNLYSSVFQSGSKISGYASQLSSSTYPNSIPVSSNISVAAFSVSLLTFKRLRISRIILHPPSITAAATQRIPVIIFLFITKSSFFLFYVFKQKGRRIAGKVTLSLKFYFCLFISSSVSVSLSFSVSVSATAEALSLDCCAISTALSCSSISSGA